jgi:hypothetical protein
MFDDLFDLIHWLEHDFREENGERIHLHTRRRCAISLRLSTTKAQNLKFLRGIDFVVGDPGENNL